MRRLLRRTWGAFFTGFGRVTPVQAQAIPVLLEGRSAVLCSPTASGKTEAAVAPLIERHVPAAADRLALLYVVPTRALVNDLCRRLADPLRMLRLELVGRTGDRPRSRSKRAERAAVIVTTPESLDSMLCRELDRFEHLRAVVLDEVHLLDGTYRGDQLQVLLRRLPAGVQRVALSATVDDPAALAARYLDVPDAAVVDVGERRALDLQLVHRPEDAVRVLKERGRNKQLWFCNRRRDVEALAEALSPHWPADRLAIHHGSLARRERESVEAAMQRWRWGLCIATTTLEIGVDIGDVDSVVLYGPPPTASAFQQRLGRACRREQVITAAGVCLEPDDEATFQLQADLAREGQVEPVDTPPDLSVAVQQTLSLLFAHPTGVGRSELARLLEPLADPETLDTIWRHLVDEEWLVSARGDRLRASTRAMDRGEAGTLHGNIPSAREFRFLDARTGRLLGSALAQVSVGDTILLAGAARTVVGVRGGEVSLAAAGGGGTAPRFQARRTGGAFRWLLPPDLR